jgi:hypothetical protein
MIICYCAPTCARGTVRKDVTILLLLLSPFTGERAALSAKTRSADNLFLARRRNQQANGACDPGQGRFRLCDRVCFRFDNRIRAGPDSDFADESPHPSAANRTANPKAKSVTAADHMAVTGRMARAPV